MNFGSSHNVDLVCRWMNGHRTCELKRPKRLQVSGSGYSWPPLSRTFPASCNLCRARSLGEPKISKAMVWISRGEIKLGVDYGGVNGWAEEDWEAGHRYYDDGSLRCAKRRSALNVFSAQANAVTGPTIFDSSVFPHFDRIGGVIIWCSLGYRAATEEIVVPAELKEWIPRGRLRLKVSFLLLMVGELFCISIILFVLRFITLIRE